MYRPVSTSRASKDQMLANRRGGDVCIDFPEREVTGTFGYPCRFPDYKSRTQR